MSRLRKRLMAVLGTILLLVNEIERPAMGTEWMAYGKCQLSGGRTVHGNGGDQFRQRGGKILVHVKSVVILWCWLYATLMTIYVFLGMLFSFLNKRLGESRKIQFRDCPRHMVVRDIRQSVKSLLEISFFLAVGVYLQKQGIGLTPLRLNIPNGILMFVASMLVFDTWFYWMHRLIHKKSLYKRIHKWHHQAVTPTIWSNNSDTFLDTLFLQSYFMVAVFLLPIPFPVLIAHKIFDQVTGMIGHSGYEYFPGKASRYPSPLIGVTFHDQHHQHVAYNYATHFSFWDRVMKTVHPDYDHTIDAFTAKSGAVSLESTLDS